MMLGTSTKTPTRGAAVPLAQQYEERLRLIEAYERAGFYAYHIAEHHATPLGMAPSPSVFLAAVAQRTRRLRFGPVVYPLTFPHPLRVAGAIGIRPLHPTDAADGLLRV